MKEILRLGRKLIEAVTVREEIRVDDTRRLSRSKWMIAPIRKVFHL